MVKQILEEYRSILKPEMILSEEEIQKRIAIITDKKSKKEFQKEAKTSLIRQFYFLIEKYAKKTSDKFDLDNQYLEDMVSEGYIALETACRKFDPNTGNKFVTYLAFWIKARILKYMETIPLVKISTNSKMIYQQIKKEQNRIYDEEGDSLSEDEIFELAYENIHLKEKFAKESGKKFFVFKNHVKDIKRKMYSIEDQTDTPLKAILSSTGFIDNSSNNNESDILNDRLEYFNQYLKTVDVRTAKIIQLKRDYLTLEQISEYEGINVKSERVRQIINETLKDFLRYYLLNSNLESEKLNQYLKTVEIKTAKIVELKQKGNTIKEISKHEGVKLRKTEVRKILDNTIEQFLVYKNNTEKFQEG